MATFTWVGGTSASWNTPADWVGGFVPLSGDFATISQSGSGAYTISADTTTLINGLTVANANATLSFAGATTLTVAGGTTLSAGTIRMWDTPGVLSTATFVESGTGKYDQTGGTLNVTGAGTALSVSAGSFTTSGGNFVVTNGASFTGGTEFVNNFNAGTLTIGGGAFHFAGGYQTIGGVSVVSGSLDVQSNLLSTKSLAMSGGTYTIEGIGKQTVSGAVNFTGGAFTESAGLLSVTGAGSVFSVAGSGSSFNLTGGAVVISNGATLAGASATISGGTFNAGTLAVGGKFTLSGGTMASSGATTPSNGTFLIQSTGTLATASLAVTGGTFTESAGQITTTGLANFTGGSDTISGGTFNAGTLSVGAGSLGLSGGSITINPGGGNVNIAGGGSIAMSGTAAVLDATNGGIADSGSIVGFGTINGVLSGSGIVRGHNGLLDLTSNIGGNTGLAFQIDGGSLARMQLDGTVGWEYVQVLHFDDDRVVVSISNIGQVIQIAIRDRAGAENRFVMLKEVDDLVVAHLLGHVFSLPVSCLATGLSLYPSLSLPQVPWWCDTHLLASRVMPPSRGRQGTVTLRPG